MLTSKAGTCISHDAIVKRHVLRGKEFPYKQDKMSAKQIRTVSECLWVGNQLRLILMSINMTFRHINHSFPPDPGWVSYYGNNLRDVLHINKSSIDPALLKKGWIVYRWTQSVHKLLKRDLKEFEETLCND